jgi:aspartate aminotransferase
MVILNSPGNPTGTVYTENELAALAEVALDEEILILSDEIYEKIIFDGQKHVSVASFSNQVYNNTITINGFSKTYAMTGWRVGYLAAPKNIAKAIDSYQSHTVSHATSFAQKGALAAYRGPQDCVDTMVKEYLSRRDKACALLDRAGKLKYVKPQGAFYILIDISETGYKSIEFSEKLLKDKQVAVVPGEAFGDDSTVRISFATDSDSLEKGLRKLIDFAS